MYCSCLSFFFFKQKTADEMRISDWSSDVCSSDLWQVTVAASGGAFPLFWAGAIVRSEDPALSPGRDGQGQERPKHGITMEHHRSERADEYLMAHPPL